MIRDSVANDMSAIVIGLSTSNGNITVQYDGIIGLVSVLLAFGLLLLMRHRDIFTPAFILFVVFNAVVTIVSFVTAMMG